MLIQNPSKPNVNLADWRQLTSIVPLEQALRAPSCWLKTKLFDLTEAEPHLADEAQHLLNLKAAKEAGTMRVS